MKQGRREARYYISKPFNWGTGTVVHYDGKFIEFSTEEEAWEFYREKRKEVLSI